MPHRLALCFLRQWWDLDGFLGCRAMLTVLLNRTRAAREPAREAAETSRNGMHGASLTGWHWCWGIPLTEYRHPARWPCGGPEGSVCNTHQMLLGV
jgi:hypothetical protein